MSNYVYPKFQTFEEFELFVNEIFKKRTQNINFQIYWRAWQNQYWIDGFWYDYLESKTIVIQCKNFKKEKKGIDEKLLIKALKKFDEKKLPFYKDVSLFYYVTAENRDKKYNNIEIKLNKSRRTSKLKPIKIVTWDDLCDDLEKYEEILYHFFLKSLHSEKAENIKYNLKTVKETSKLIFWDEIQKEKIDSFKSTFSKKIWKVNGNEKESSILLVWVHWYWRWENFDKEVDLDLDFSKIYNNCVFEWLDEFLTKISKLFTELKKEIGLNTIILKSHIQPCLAIYIWRYFKSSSIEFITQINNKEIFTSSKSKNLLFSSPKISEKKIYINQEWSENDLLLIFNITQSIELDSIMKKGIFSRIKPKFWFHLYWEKISNSSQSFSQCNYLADKIKDLANFYNNWCGLKIHLILICPEQIAFIIWTLLERINANIFLYYQDSESKDYINFWELPNN